MIFSSYSFIFLFLPVTLLGFHLLRRTGRERLVKLWLTAASLVFYGLGQPDFLAGFVLTLLLNYLLILLMDKSRKKAARRAWLTLAVAWNLGLLFWFKYLNFTIANVNLLFGTHIGALKLILPIGISFFTFQILAFTVSFYRGERGRPGLLDYSVFVTFFPQLIVGPVVRHDEVMPYIEGRTLLDYDAALVPRGVMLFSMGCAKKILLADTLIAFASAYYTGGGAAGAGLFHSWMAVLAYTFAYYFDFSGYIDMARGLGCFFGVELPINFDSPYKARDFGDFWRRWNITISRFFNETVFQNLFGFGDGVGKLVFATMATFLVSGVWHGAAWHYILWGLVNGALVTLANIRALKDRKPLPAWLAVALTFLAGALVRVLFDCTGLTQAVMVYRKLFDVRELLHARTFLRSALTFVKENLSVTLTMAAGAVICFAFPNSNALSERERYGWREAVFSAALLALSLLCMRRVSTFLYFNF